MKNRYILPILVGILGIIIIILGILAFFMTDKITENNSEVTQIGTTLGESVINVGEKDEEEEVPDQAVEPEVDEYALKLEEIDTLIEIEAYPAALNEIEQLILDSGETAELIKLRDDVVLMYKDNVTAQLDGLIYGYDYAGGQELLEPLMKYCEDDERLTKLYDMCVSFQNTYLFEGTVEHIFFHPLIAYPELAFDGDYSEAGLDSYMATVPEFKAILAQLYERGYILIDPHLMYTVNEDGTVAKNDLYLPEGKKPVILSMDDYNFMQYMRENGMVHGLALDENGNVVTFTDDKDGNRTYSDDNEIVPITDKFVYENPDFSYGGFKGAIGLNGYEGTLGYPTDQLDSPTYEADFAAAKAVADRLKETGWIFACHSYGHNHYAKKSLAFMKNDVDKWIDEVGSIVGETDLYFYPYGEIIDQDDAKFLYMKERGYKFFFGASQVPYLKYYDDNILQTRRNIDGIGLRGWRLAEMLDTAAIIDSVRPEKYNKQ